MMRQMGLVWFCAHYNVYSAYPCSLSCYGAQVQTGWIFLSALRITRFDSAFSCPLRKWKIKHLRSAFLSVIWRLSFGVQLFSVLSEPPSHRGQVSVFLGEPFPYFIATSVRSTRHYCILWWKRLANKHLCSRQCRSLYYFLVYLVSINSS